MQVTYKIQIVRRKFSIREFLLEEIFLGREFFRKNFRARDSVRALVRIYKILRLTSQDIVH